MYMAKEYADGSGMYLCADHRDEWYAQQADQGDTYTAETEPID